GIMDNGFSFDMRMSKLDTDGYVDRSHADNYSFYMSGAWRNNKNLVRANIIHGKQLTGLSYYGVVADSLETNRKYNESGEYYDKNGVRRYYEDESSYYLQTHYHLIYSREINSHWNLNTALHYTNGFGYYEQYRYNKKLLTYGYNSSNKTDLVTRKNMLNDFYGISYSLSYSKNKINAVFGGATNQYDGHHYGNVVWMLEAFDNEVNKEYYRNSGLKNDISNFLKLDYAVLSNLSIYADIQHRYITYKMQGRDDKLLPDNTQKVLDQEHQFNFINPKAGAFYDINDNMNVYASFAIGNREPTRTHFKDATGDSNLQPKPEKLYDYELGWRFNNAKFLSAVNLYYMDYIDQIIPTGEKNSVGYDIMTNAPESYRMGVELSVAWQILKTLSFSANTTLSRNKIRNYTQWASFYDESWNETYISYNLGETDIALSPSIIGAGVLQWNAFKNFTASLTSKYVGEQYFDNTMSNDRKLDAYFVNNIQFDYLIETKLIKEIGLRFTINNIFDVKYSNDAYGGMWFEQNIEKTWAYYFPQAGINFMGGLSLKF
ncbi:MAG: TonB-dependent receptor, partial [Bacteroidales bacterium]|nr:TonB-dependent receptor [Bacteroidales bacterium]